MDLIELEKREWDKDSESDSESDDDSFMDLFLDSDSDSDDEDALKEDYYMQAGIEQARINAEINELMEDIDGYNDIIEENEAFFTNEFEDFDGEIKDLLQNVVEEESNLMEIEMSLEESKSLRADRKRNTPEAVTPVDDSKEIDALINWFIPTFLLTLICGTLLGGLIVTIYYRVCIAKQ